MKNNRFFLSLVCMSQCELKEFLRKELVSNYGERNVSSKDGYLMARGEIPVTLVAHLDTVHERLPSIDEILIEGNCISSPNGIGGDDRCGVWIIISLIRQGMKPTVIFTEDEEIHCIGARKFITNRFALDLVKRTNFIVELDRRGNNDAVFYNCENKDFQEFIISNGWELAYGSCSDISYIAPASNRAAVNLSVAYYNPHTLSEYINLKELENIKVRVQRLIRSQRYLKKVYEYGN